MDGLVKSIGWPALMLHGDPCVTDRWLWVRKHLGPGRTLDAGAGNGGFAIYAAKRGSETVALSFDEGEVEAGHRRAQIIGAPVEFRLLDLRELDRHELGRFNQILCLEVAEHIQDDAKLLRDLSRLLVPGGRLILTTPSADHRPLLGERLSESEDGGHVRWGYSHEQMAGLMREAGLEPVVQGHVSGAISQRLTNLMRRFERIHRAVGWAVVLPLRILHPLDRIVTRLLGYPYLCIAVVGEKR